MSDTVFIIWAITFLVLLVGCIPYGIWMAYTLVKKRWRRLILQAAIPGLALIMLAGISVIVNTVAYDRYLTELFDADVELDEPIFEYHSERAFNGDGYSISVYELPAAIRTRFEGADEKLLSNFPKSSDDRDDWIREHWRRTPVEESFEEHLNFALSTYDAREASELEMHFEAIRSALGRDGAFYAFIYNPQPGYVANIDCFIVDLIGGRLYMINCNT